MVVNEFYLHFSGGEELPQSVIHPRRGFWYNFSMNDVLLNMLEESKIGIVVQYLHYLWWKGEG